MVVPGQLFYKIIALAAVLIGFIGALLPLLPTTPFLLIAIWAASRGSPQLKSWLMNHRHFGPVLNDWYQRRAIPVTGKCLACGMMLSSWLVLWYSGGHPYLLWGLGFFFVGLILFIVSRPSS
ncbi:YbaN family protein [Kangiella shandongensis]|uniref:YbaN family protein n=1 Tax=Kangiella shandongensis TaxID=2763258 RepID=UPI001CBF92F0|nr:YbaN family protein [Kangiella shandongensis]